MYLEVRNSFDVLGRFVNLYIMVLMVAIMKDFSVFIDHGHYVDHYGKMKTIMKNFSAFLIMVIMIAL